MGCFPLELEADAWRKEHGEYFHVLIVEIKEAWLRVHLRLRT
jgi:hypothetical protein